MSKLANLEIDYLTIYPYYYVTNHGDIGDYMLRISNPIIFEEEFYERLIKYGDVTPMQAYDKAGVFLTKETETIYQGGRDRDDVIVLKGKY